MHSLMKLWAERIYETKINNKREDQSTIEVKTAIWHKEVSTLNGQQIGKIIHEVV